MTLSSIHLHQNHADLISMKEVPESYAWTTVQASLDLQSDSDPVPVIDLDDPKAMEKVGLACRKWGVFQVINHQIDIKVLEDMEMAGNKLFSLPIETKLQAARQPGDIAGYGSFHISSFFTKKMWSEAFTVFGSPTEKARLLWPNSYTEFCDVIEEYETEMRKLSRKLMRLLLGSLGVSMDDVKWSTEQDGTAVTQFNFYPACPEPDRAMGLATHTDTNIFTILYQSNTSGLQVLLEENKWLTVPPVPGALVINIGDLFHMLSNGSYSSTIHRAVVNRTRHRLSIAYFNNSPGNVVISPLPNLVDSTHPALYRPVTWPEYLGIKTKHFNKALSMVRVGAGSLEVNEEDGLEVGI